MLGHAYGTNHKSDRSVSVNCVHCVNRFRYPIGPWRVSVDAPTSSAVSWGAWKRASTAMNLTTNGSRAATWLYSEHPGDN